LSVFDGQLQLATGLHTTHVEPEQALPGEHALLQGAAPAQLTVLHAFPPLHARQSVEALFRLMVVVPQDPLPLHSIVQAVPIAHVMVAGLQLPPPLHRTRQANPGGQVTLPFASITHVPPAQPALQTVGQFPESPASLAGASAGASVAPLSATAPPSSSGPASTGIPSNTPKSFVQPNIAMTSIATTKGT
jgi:hypothetical protein